MEMILLPILFFAGVAFGFWSETWFDPPYQYDLPDILPGEESKPLPVADEPYDPPTT